MAKLTLTDITDPSSQATMAAAINANSVLVEAAVENTLSRDGTSPNEMDALLDMNSHHIINLPAATQNGQAVRYNEFRDAVFGEVPDVSDSITSILNVVTPEMFGSTGTSDDTAVIQEFFDYLSDNDLSHGCLTKWYNTTAEILISSGTNRWHCTGIGKYICGLKRNSTDNFTVLRLDSDNWTISNFGINGQVSVHGTSTHGLSVHDASNWSVKDIYVTDFSSTGILGTTTTPGFVNGLVENCHIDGNNTGSNGISFSGMEYSVQRGNFVENVNTGTPCIGHQLKGGCIGSVIENGQAKNCFIGVGFQNNDGGTLWPMYCTVRNMLITDPNPNASAATTSYGARFAAGRNNTFTDITIDGNVLADFVAFAMSANNEPTQGRNSAKFTAFNTQGTDSYLLSISEPDSLVVVEYFDGANAVPIRINPGALRSTVVVGKRDTTELYAPWLLVEDNVSSSTNRTVLLHDKTTLFLLDDDEVKTIPVTDGATSGMLQIWTNAPDNVFSGWARVSAAPAIASGYSGSDVSIGTGALTAGTGDGVDTDMNYHAREEAILIKNRTGSTKTVGVKFTPF
jgi:hypothetical protein